MSDQQVKEILVDLKPIAEAAHNAAKVIASDGARINKDWIEDIGFASADWEGCTLNLRVRATSHTYAEHVDITLKDGTVLLDTRYYNGSQSITFDIYTFRNGPWVDRLIKYSTEGMQAKKEKKNQVELEKKLKPFTTIDF